MLLQMRPEFHCLEGEDQKTDVYKNTARIHCLEGEDEKENRWV